MNMFILEDDLMQRERMYRLIREVTTSENLMRLAVTAVSDEKKLEEQLSQSGVGNLYFLDIEIKGDPLAGLAMAQKIRQKDRYGVIVFVTTHSEFAAITYKYKISAYDFIDKSESDEQLKNRILDCLRYSLSLQQEPPGEMFSFDTSGMSVYLPFADILYFETGARSHQLHLVAKNETALFYGTLSEIQHADPRFFLCHRGVVVNLMQVEKIDRRNCRIHFSGGFSCSVSRRKIRPLINKAAEYRITIQIYDGEPED